ncbi:MAG TPA: hypothetical protein GX735_03615 [Firmicutes bacterium]|nr:hypothetical protein [Bacillota bacterium]
MARRWGLPYKVCRGTQARELVTKACISASSFYSWVPTLCRERGWETMQVVKHNLGPPSFIVNCLEDGPVDVWVLTAEKRDVTYFEGWERANPPHCHIFTSPDSNLIHPFLHWLQSLVLRPQLVVIPGGKSKAPD